MAEAQKSLGFFCVCRHPKCMGAQTEFAILVPYYDV
jgi:hypothetical protein